MEFDGLIMQDNVRVRLKIETLDFSTEGCLFHSSVMADFDRHGLFSWVFWTNRQPDKHHKPYQNPAWDFVLVDQLAHTTIENLQNETKEINWMKTIMKRWRWRSNMLKGQIDDFVTS